MDSFLSDRIYFNKSIQSVFNCLTCAVRTRPKHNDSNYTQVVLHKTLIVPPTLDSHANEQNASAMKISAAAVERLWRLAVLSAVH